MEFFFETGIYLLIVALAAGAAGFVALKVLGIGRLLRQSGRSTRRNEMRGVDSEDEFDESDLSYAGAGEKTAAAVSREKNPTRTEADSGPVGTTPPPEKPPLPKEAEAVPLPDPGPAKERIASVPGSEKPEEAPHVPAVSETETIEPGGAQDVQQVEQAHSRDAGDGAEHEETGADGAPADGPEKSVMAPPDESDEAATAHGMLALFDAGDEDDSTVGELAGTVEDVDIQDLSDAASTVVAALGSKRDSHE